MLLFFFLVGCWLVQIKVSRDRAGFPRRLALCDGGPCHGLALAFAPASIHGGHLEKGPAHLVFGHKISVNVKGFRPDANRISCVCLVRDRSVAIPVAFGGVLGGCNLFDTAGHIGPPGFRVISEMSICDGMLQHSG
jgi:hypothetical protein